MIKHTVVLWPACEKSSSARWPFW